MLSALVVFLLIGAVAYLTPTWVALHRDVPGKFWVFFINLFFGWSVLGWWMAFIFACSPSRAQVRWARQREQLAIAADEAVIAMERRSRLAIGGHP